MMAAVGDIGLGIIIGFVAALFLLAWHYEREQKATEELEDAQAAAVQAYFDNLTEKEAKDGH